jgi:uncharacterized protein (DUF1800 family)
MSNRQNRLATVTLLALSPLLVFGQDPPAPAISLSISNAQKSIQWTPYPAAQEYKIFSTANLLLPFAEISSGTLNGTIWNAPATEPFDFFQLRVTPLDSNALLTATVLNRLAYGPTPDELERLAAIGPQAYIDEQLAPELIDEQLGIDQVIDVSGWQHLVATGTATSSTLYLYLGTPGDVYIDDIVLVRGTNAETGVNLIRNGDFEAAFTTNEWQVASNFVNSAISTTVQHSGNASLHLVAIAGSTGASNAVLQGISPALVNGQTYTLSYWYLPNTNNFVKLTVRLHNSSETTGLFSSPNYPLLTELVNGIASIDDLRAWHVLHAVQSKRQLLEVLDQFLENHFVTQHSKSRDYFDTFYNGGTLLDQFATQMELKENLRWRQALLNPQVTFYDLLKISAESPAMIIYIDTVNSKGNGSSIANENYARELLELFTFGVDNGYDQNDIVQMSKAWTGWSVNIVDASNEFNPLAPRSTTVKAGVTNNFNAVSNLVGVWSFNYKSANHNTSTKTVFPGKTVPARFGPPYAGRSYQLTLPTRSGTSGMQDGYDVITHLANQPFTQEFISVKLCRMFVHDDFYIGYDFTDANLSPEGQLVKQCMGAWENSTPKGQIRNVLATIFNADLFRSHGASSQKVRTPLEFTVSTIRALRSANANGTFTADTDGYALRTPMKRMGEMNLFDRAEPDGYPETAPGWISAGTLAERLRFVQSVLIAAGQNGKTDAGDRNVTDPVSLLKKKLTNASWNNAGAVADYFVGILFPGEGKANLALYRNLAVNFLNTADDGVSSSVFNNLAVSSSAGSVYDNRLRGMVAMLLTFQRFQDQ